MATLGNGTLDNDAALDFILDLEESPVSGRPQMIHLRLRGVVERADYLEGSDADAALAAAVLVLAAAGGAVPEALGSTAAAAAVVSTLPAPDAQLMQQARAAVLRVTSDSDNEWLELWTEAPELDAATARRRALMQALGRLPAPKYALSGHPTSPRPTIPPTRGSWCKAEPIWTVAVTDRRSVRVSVPGPMR
jgi:Domain of unknown function (DUF4259)